MIGYLLSGAVVLSLLILAWDATHTKVTPDPTEEEDRVYFYHDYFENKN